MKRFIARTICLVNILLMLCPSDSIAQPENFIGKKHEVGIDVTNTLSFLKKNYQSYLLNYRYYFKNQQFALRAGLNLDISDGISDGKYPSGKLGIQRNHFDKNWNTYYGLDLSYYYYKSNATPISTTRYGITPLVGVQFFTKNRLSISTEAGLNFHHFVVRSKNSFDPLDNTSYTQVNIGYVGMFLVSYHF